MDYIDAINTNPIAITVKPADLKHTSDITRILNPGPVDYDRVVKYKKA